MPNEFIINTVVRFNNMFIRSQKSQQNFQTLYEENALGLTDDVFIAAWHSFQFPDPESLPIQFDPQRDGD